MKLKHYILFTFLILLIPTQLLKAQIIVCPPNIDFENGNYSYWKFYTGTCCPIATPTMGQVINRHTLTTGVAVDPTGGFPIVAPGGGNYSLKLGNSISGAQAERAEYSINIPSNVNNYSLIYRYAVVFQDPGHPVAQQPRFEVKAFDSTTGSLIPCTQATYVASSNLPGFTCHGDTCFRGWATASLNLSGYAGHTVVVSFASGDCANGGHFAYGYIDLACSLFQISSVVCSGSPTQNLVAPPGFQTYTWYDSNYVNVIATGQNTTINTPTYNTSYHVILAPFPGYGCTDTLSGNFVITNPTFSNLYDTICAPASYFGHTTSGTYVDTLVNAAGCDSIRTLHLVVNPKTYSILYDTICQTNSYLGYSATGTYIDTLVNANGCDSIRTLHLMVNTITNSTVNQTICQPNSYLGYSSTGTYIDTLVNSQGCDSIRTLHLTVNPITNSSFNQTICQPNSYWGYSTSGTYTNNFINVNGCDSLRTLNLTVKPILYSSISNTICAPATYLGYNATGVYLDTFISASGCDSIRTLNLTVNSTSSSSINQTICQPYSYLGYNATGTYVDILTNAVGCDSVRTLQLLVNPIAYSTINQTICQPNMYLGYNATGTYLDTFVNSNTCDSVRTLNLTVNPITYSTINQTICQPNLFLGYNTTGTYVDSFINANGCDSVRTLHLIVNPITYSTLNETICEPNSFLGYSLSGTYIDHLVNANGCDSVRTLNLTVNNITYSYLTQTICEPNDFLGYSTSGTYLDTFTTSNGCDSVRTLFLTVNKHYIKDTVINICVGESYFVGGAMQTQAGIYWDSLYTSLGCDSITRTFLNLKNKVEPDFGMDKTICVGDSVVIYPGAFNYYWWYDGDVSVDRKTINSAGTYIVKVSNFIGCYGYDTIIINTFPAIHVKINYSTKDLCQADTINLKGSGALQYNWYLDEYFTTPRFVGEVYNFSITKPTTITLIGSDENNCKSSDAVTLYYVPCCGNVIIPNAFSPNGDGSNDLFKPITSARFENYEFTVFDRWGNVVFKTNRLEEGWDGSYKNGSADMNNYFYLIRYKCYGETKSNVIKGDVLLIK